MSDITDILRRLESLIRFGTIAEVDYAKRRAKVTSGGIRTDWLPWLEWRAGTTRSWSPPTVGEQCMILAASGELTTAAILSGIFTTDFNNPGQSPDEHVIEFADGARILYDQKSHMLKVMGIATAHIQASSSVVLETPLVKCTQNVEIGGNVSVGGAVTSSGDQVAGGISQINHVHGSSPKPS
ncbi:phage baseplate assembly protein V [Actinobacillus seminis]|uniref:phage baseplate assembly protein V n=1 Tax=Actinobacillus seminis TaxID=722 RepID=UPI003B93DAD8